MTCEIKKTKNTLSQQKQKKTHLRIHFGNESWIKVRMLMIPTPHIPVSSVQHNHIFLFNHKFNLLRRKKNLLRNHWKPLFELHSVTDISSDMKSQKTFVSAKMSGLKSDVNNSPCVRGE